MAEIEVGQIRIIPDWFNYALQKGETTTISGHDISSAHPYYQMLDHKQNLVMRIECGGSTAHFNFTVAWAVNSTNRASMILFAGDNITSKDGKVIMRQNGSEITTNTVATVNATDETGGYYTSSGGNIWGFEQTNATGVNGFRISDNAGTYDGDIDIGICHFGGIFEMPSNAITSLSDNHKFITKQNKTIGGAYFSSIHSHKSQRIFKASWDFIKWDWLDPTIAQSYKGVNGFNQMLTQCWGSHIPVVIQLSQEGTMTDDHFMFARITGMEHKQRSADTWQVSMTAEELIRTD